jgi:hypothetical protein
MDDLQRGLIPECEHTPQCRWHSGPCADKHNEWLAARRRYPQPTEQNVSRITKAASEMADMIQLLDLSNEEYNDWQVIMGAMGPSTYERKMDDA